MQITLKYTSNMFEMISDSSNFEAKNILNREVLTVLSRNVQKWRLEHEDGKQTSPKIDFYTMFLIKILN